MSLHAIGFIFARGNSKEVPKKNLRLLAGKPLIAYAIESARACKLIDRVIVSTEDCGNRNRSKKIWGGSAFYET